MDIKLNSSEMFAICKKVANWYHGDLEGIVFVSIHGFTFSVEWYFDEDNECCELGISEIKLVDHEDVNVTFNQDDERFAMSVACLSLCINRKQSNNKQR